MNDRNNKEFKHTQCEWKPFRFRPVPERSATYEEIKSMLYESVDRTVEHGDSINDFYMVLSQWDQDPVYMAESYRKQDIKNHIEKVKIWIKNKVPLNKRYALEV